MDNESVSQGAYLGRGGITVSLLGMPEVIREAEMVYVEAQNNVEGLKLTLERREDALLLGGSVEGANQAGREANLRWMTMMERDAIATAQAHLRERTAELHYAQNQYAALRAIARLIGGSNG